MPWKQVLIVLLSITSVFLAPTDDHTIVGNGEEINIVTPEYPEPSPIGTSLKWNLKTEEKTNLLLYCEDLRISPSEDCKNGYLMVFDGVKEEKFCGSEYGLTIKSISNEMRIEYDVNWASGVAKCTVKGVDQDVESGWKDDNLAYSFGNDGEINLIPGKHAYDQIYNSNIEKNLNKKWSFKTRDGAVISIHCNHIEIGKDCGKAKVELIDDNGKETICETKTKFKKLSSSNKLTVTLTTGAWSGGRINCLVQAVTGKDEFEYRNIASTEVDSSEYGQKEGARKTDCKCGWSAKSPARIVNGQEVDDGQYPWIVSLNHKGEHSCGGSIITSRHILTAAHCFAKNNKAKDWIVYVGTINNTHTSNGQNIRVKEIINHEYEAGKYHLNDITILLLENEIKFTNRIGPVCLTPEKHLLDHKFITVSGWGALGPEGDWENPQQLMRAHMRVVDYNTCSYLWYRKFDTSNPNRLCTWATNRDSCFGDSGGPLVWLDPETNRYTQVGLVSFGRGCNTDYPKVNTLVAHYYSWIQDVVKRTNPELQTCRKI